MALHDKLSIGPYTLECVGFTQDSNANYNSEYALLDVYKGGKKQFQMTPEKRVYLASGQPQTMVAIHSVPSGICTWCMRARIPTPASRLSRRF
jgi:cytochrome c-type biogenesis protein CcmF